MTWYYTYERRSDVDTKTIVKTLREHGLRVTPQRISVYEYLIHHKTHPDAEEIYNALRLADSTVTRATVHNNLHKMKEHGLALEITVDGDRLRYDGNTDTHGHFICSCCSKIYDFDVDKLEISGLSGFKTQTKDIFFGGLCKKCIN